MDIKKIVTDFERETGGEVAIGVVDLKNNIDFFYKESKKFTAASLNKLFIVSLVLQKIENKKLAFLNEYTIPEEARVGGTGIIHLLTQKAFNLHDLCMLAIIESDNTAANKLIDLVGGIEEVNEYIKKLGLTDTELTHKFMLYNGESSSTTSVRDLVKFLNKLSKGELALSLELKEIMLEQKNRIRTAALINVPIGLKTADLPHPEAVVHDAGIIFDKAGDIILVVLAEGVKDRKNTQLLMQKMARSIYDQVVWAERLTKSLPRIQRLIKPVKGFSPNSFSFGENIPRWGRHLGQDVNVKAGATVSAAANGIVVYSATHPGSKDKCNWGNIVIIAHNLDGKIIFTLYGHLGERAVEVGEVVKSGITIGKIGKENTPENGWWEEHLHFGIYKGKFSGTVLPGYAPPGKIEEWLDPRELLGLR